MHLSSYKIHALLLFMLLLPFGSLANKHTAKHAAQQPEQHRPPQQRQQAQQQTIKHERNKIQSPIHPVQHSQHAVQRTQQLQQQAWDHQLIPQQQQQQQQQHPHREAVTAAPRVVAPKQQRSLKAADSAQQLSVPVYGNWCGPYYGQGKPVDAMDQCCQMHDRCYSKLSYNRCSCDRDIVACVGRLSLRSDDVIRKAMRTAIRSYFVNTACRCPNNSWTMPVAQSMC